MSLPSHPATASVHRATSNPCRLYIVISYSTTAWLVTITKRLFISPSGVNTLGNQTDTMEIGNTSRVSLQQPISVHPSTFTQRLSPVTLPKCQRTLRPVASPPSEKDHLTRFTASDSSSSVSTGLSRQQSASRTTVERRIHRPRGPLEEIGL